VLAVAGGIATTVLTGCAGGGSASSRSPQGYVNHALQLVERHAIYAPALDWSAVAGHARELAGGAKATRGTYPAIRYVVERLHDAGDEHAFFLAPAAAKRYTPGAPSLEASSPPPSVSILDGGVGLVRVPAISSSPRSANSRRYASAALTSIRRLAARRHPCGWVVDLRSNTGGDMFPMLLSVGPIVGEGRLIGFRGRRGMQYFVSYRRGVLSGGGFTDRAPLAVPDLEPVPPRSSPAIRRRARVKPWRSPSAAGRRHGASAPRRSAR
jgi:carboxyl-terminal processing protease